MSRSGPAQFVKLASSISSYYGFRPVAEFSSSRRVASFSDAAVACASLFSLRAPEPVLGFYSTPTPSHMPEGLQAREAAEFGLQIVGSGESIGEILILKTLASIVNEWGAPIARVRINALGDKDSQQRFARELSSYLRRRADVLEDSIRVRLMHNPLSAYSIASEPLREILEEGPRSMHFLSEKSRSHFREVLEQLEEIEIPYELDDMLIGDERGPRIVFCIDLAGEDATILGNIGGRFDEFVSRISGKQTPPSVSASIYFRKKGADRSCFNSRTPLRPKVYFVQLGTRAKLQGFEVVDTLRRARIPVFQAFDTSKLAPQLSAAQKSGVSYVLIMGQREALDRTVIVRSISNSSQTVVGLDRLPRMLKTLRV